MSDWKSHYGVSDQGASNAGVYGTPNSTWEIARAQEETLKLQRSYWEQVPAASPPDYGTPYTPPPLPLPGAMSHTGAYSGYYPEPRRGGGLKGFLKGIVILMGAGLLLSVVLSFLPAIISLATSSGPARPLATAHYERLSAQARTLSAQPTSRLYANHLRQASPDWASLSPKQQAAVAAAWIRYTRDPAAFRKLAPKQKAFTFAAFESYLQALAAVGDKQAVKDLAHLATTTR
ncbi:MAG: hypothetical protein EOP93_04410 [Lysobacteraceae bacterium]|nr:MAG: hypothetical protein EOP93_04410 [Xanthomonadaceae bacterium]